MHGPDRDPTGNAFALEGDALTGMYADWPDVETRPRANRDDLQLARIARTYVQTIGDPTQVEQICALRLEGPYSPDSVPRLISRARKRGLLTSTTRGRAGGMLTPKAQALLRQAEETK
jgi:hypothetical protein